MIGRFRSCVSVFVAVGSIVSPTDCPSVLADDHVVSQKDLLWLAWSP